MRLAPLALFAGAVCTGAAAPVVHSAMMAEGEQAFQKCYACHSLEGPDPRLQGPSLKGIVGREVATETGFGYSPAMRVYAGRQTRWSREALDAFIADPQAAAPGNAMGFFGIRDPEERCALIEYLARS